MCNKFQLFNISICSIFLLLNSTQTFAKEPDCKINDIRQGIGLDITYIAYGAYSDDGRCTGTSTDSIRLVIDRSNINATTLTVIKGTDIKNVLSLSKDFQKLKLPSWALDAIENNIEIIKSQTPDISTGIVRQLAERSNAAAKVTEDSVKADKAYLDSLAKMNAGQLFAKADELASQGDKVKAREVLRSLVSRFPDHPLAATAAQQMAAMGNAGNANASAGGSGKGQNFADSSGSNGNCEKALADLESRLQQIERKPLPQGFTPPTQRLMYLAEETIKVTRANCPNEGKYAQSIKEMQTTFNQAKTMCGQATSSESVCVANPFDGTITPAMRAEKEEDDARIAKQKADKEAADWAKAAEILTNAIQKRKQQQSGGRTDNRNCSPYCTVK